jgi:hypothetical protein
MLKIIVVQFCGFPVGFDLVEMFEDDFDFSNDF